MPRTGRGNSFGSGSMEPRRAAAKADRFDLGITRRSGIYPRKGSGHGQIGEAQHLDLLRKWNAASDWSRWRRGMELAYRELASGNDQFQPVEVLHQRAFRPAAGLQVSSAMLVGFRSRASPDGRWTCAIKPRGVEIALRPITADCQSDLTFITAAEEELPLLVVTLPGLFFGGRPDSADPLIGELIEDTGISADDVIDEHDEATILMCVAVYEDEGLMAFDATRRWRRERQANGRSVLREVAIGRDDPPPRFRVGRHLCQSTVISCNCPDHLGVEYGRLLGDRNLGVQALYPLQMPGGQLVSRPLSALTDRVFRAAPEQRPLQPLEGVARRFTLLGWQRPPAPCCKHVHAVRFALGCPIAEPDDIPAVIDTTAQMADGLMPYESMAPLAQRGLIEQLERRMLFDEAVRGLASTVSAGAVGDAFGVTIEKVGVAPVQTGTPVRRAVVGDPRFAQQWATERPEQVADALLGDVWVGRLTAQWSFPFLGAGELADQPFFLPSQVPPQLLP